MDLLQRNQRNSYLHIQYIDVIVGDDSSEILRDFHHKKELNQQMKRRRDKFSQKKSDLSLTMTESKSYSVIKSIQGSYNQGHEVFRTTTGMQCTCISLVSLCWSVIREVSI